MIDLPEKYFRYSTKKSREELSKKLNIKIEKNQQDWEYEIADFNRIDEFINLYKNGSLSDDEKFYLMETIIQSFEESRESTKNDLKWKKVLNLIEINIDIHIYTTSIPLYEPEPHHNLQKHDHLSQYFLKHISLQVTHNL